MPPHLVQPCSVALGHALIRGLYPDWFEGFVNWVPLPKLGPAVDRDNAHLLSVQVKRACTNVQISDVKKFIK